MINLLKNKPAILLGVISVLALIVYIIAVPDKYDFDENEAPPPITEAVLQILKEQNSDKRLEYAESQPIIKSMSKHLYQFDSLMKVDREKARGVLLIVERRLLYLKAKGLDISGANEIIRNFVETYIAKRE